MSKLNSTALISATFLSNPLADSLIIFEDGNCFLPADKHHADYHGRVNKTKGREVMREDYKESLETLAAEQLKSKAAAAKPITKTPKEAEEYKKDGLTPSTQEGINSEKGNSDAEVQEPEKSISKKK